MESWVPVSLVTAAKCLDNSWLFPFLLGEEMRSWFHVGGTFHPQNAEDNFMWIVGGYFLLVNIFFFVFPEYLPVLSGFWYWQLFSAAEFCRTCSSLWSCDGLRGAFQFPQALGLHSGGSWLKTAKFLTWCLLLCLCFSSSPFFLSVEMGAAEQWDCKEQIGMKLWFRAVAFPASSCTVAQYILFKYGLALTTSTVCLDCQNFSGVCSVFSPWRLLMKECAHWDVMEMLLSGTECVN